MVLLCRIRNHLQKVDPELIFTKQERIGKGSFGEVFKGIDNRTQQVSIENTIVDKRQIILKLCTIFGDIAKLN